MYVLIILSDEIRQFYLEEVIM